MNLNVADLIKKMANDENVEIYSSIAKVTGVDTIKKTCVVEPLDGSPEINGVKYAIDNGGSSGFELIPVVGSFVIVSFLSESTAFVSQLTSFDQLCIKNATTSLKTILIDILSGIKLMTMTAPPSGGVTSTPINAASFTAIEQKINGLFNE